MLPYFQPMLYLISTGTPDLEAKMLDAFIIDRIRQRQIRPRDSAQVPLRIEVPEPEQAPRQEERGEKEERGVVVIDFTL
jgi:hypothetical protein